MVKNKAISESAYISELAIHGIQEKKGNDIIRLDLRNIFSSVADYFVICTGGNARQIQAISEEIGLKLRKQGEYPMNVEGFEAAEWVLADYGNYLLTQAPPLTLTVPQGFALDRFMEVVLRIMGLNAQQASALREKFAANPAAFFPIGIRFDMDIHDVGLNSGSGVLLQNGDKVGEMAFAWSTADRSYFIAGQLTEAQVVEIANSIK